MSLVKFHLSLNVSDVARSVAFYEAFFGVPPHKRRADYADFDLTEPPLNLARNGVRAPPGVGALDHLGLQTPRPEQVQAARERLEASGPVSFDEGDTVCCYARTTRSGCRTRTATSGRFMCCLTMRWRSGDVRCRRCR